MFYYSIYTPFHDADKPDTATGVKVWQSLANAMILLGVVIVMTMILLLLYKFRCYKVMYKLNIVLLSSVVVQCIINMHCIHVYTHLTANPST